MISHRKIMERRKRDREIKALEFQVKKNELEAKRWENKYYGLRGKARDAVNSQMDALQWLVDLQEAIEG